LHLYRPHWGLTHLVTLLCCSWELFRMCWFCAPLQSTNSVVARAQTTCTGSELLRQTLLFLCCHILHRTIIKWAAWSSL
jgi:hypothetical protein